MYAVEQSRVNSEVKRLACTLVQTAFQENDYWFFQSDFGKMLLEEMPEAVQVKAKDFCVRFKREKAQVTKQAVSAARLLIDDNFVSVWNMLGGVLYDKVAYAGA